MLMKNNVYILLAVLLGFCISTYFNRKKQLDTKTKIELLNKEIELDKKIIEDYKLSLKSLKDSIDFNYVPKDSIKVITRTKYINKIVKDETEKYLAKDTLDRIDYFHNWLVDSTSRFKEASRID